MKLEVLVATVGQEDLSLVDTMNIQGHVRITNQATGHGLVVEERSQGRVEMLTLPDEGVGLNRNLGLMRSSADICLMADDDVEYCDGYVEAVLNEFATTPHADVILFNVPYEVGGRSQKPITRRKRLSRWTAPPYSATMRIAVRRASILDANVYFSLLFGGGAKYASGEDVLFVVDCIKRGLRVYATPVVIGRIRHSPSSWFTGYNAKYFFDKGVFLARISPRLAPILALLFAVKHAKLERQGITWVASLRHLLDGARSRGS